MRKYIPFWQYIMFRNVLAQVPTEPANIISATHFPKPKVPYNPYAPNTSWLKQMERQLDLIDSEHRSF
jgi:hypothetical protein